MRGQLEIDLRSSNSWIRLIKSVVAVETFAATSAGLDMVVSTKYWDTYRRQKEESLKALRSGKFTENTDLGEDEHFVQVIGCPAVIVYALGQIVSSIRDRQRAEHAGVCSAHWLESWQNETAKLEDLITRWKPCNEDMDRVHLMEAFRHAALVYYCHHIHGLSYTHATLQRHVRKTFEHLMSLRPGSQLEGIALWPTMIAAIDIDEQNNPDLMDIAIELIRLMAEQKKDPLYIHAERALQLLWNRRLAARSLEHRTPINWEELSKEMDWKWCMV